MPPPERSLKRRFAIVRPQSPAIWSTRGLGCPIFVMLVLLFEAAVLGEAGGGLITIVWAFGRKLVQHIVVMQFWVSLVSVSQIRPELFQIVCCLFVLQWCEGFSPSVFQVALSEGAATPTPVSTLN